MTRGRSLALLTAACLVLSLPAPSQGFDPNELEPVGSGLTMASIIGALVIPVTSPLSMDSCYVQYSAVQLVGLELVGDQTWRALLHGQGMPWAGVEADPAMDQFLVRFWYGFGPADFVEGTSPEGVIEVTPTPGTWPVRVEAFSLRLVGTEYGIPSSLFGLHHGYYGAPPGAWLADVPGPPDTYTTQCYDQWAEWLLGDTLWLAPPAW